MTGPASRLRGAGVSATVAPPAPEETPAAPPPPDAVTQTLSAPKLALRAVGGGTLLPLPLARTIAFVALAAWGALHWMSLLEPREPNRAWLALAVGLSRSPRCSGPASSPAAAGNWPRPARCCH